MVTEEILDRDLPIWDAHHHLWDFSQPYPGLPQRYLLSELLEDTGTGHNVIGTTFVEAHAFYKIDGPVELYPVGETEFANGTAAMAASGRYGRTRACGAIVANADLLVGGRIEELLAAHQRAGNGRLRGIRRVTAWHEDGETFHSHVPTHRGMMADARFREGFAKLGSFDLSFDAWIYHPQIDELADLASTFPDTPIVLDHIGGPLGIGPYANRRAEVFANWKASIQFLAMQPNVSVKLGGLGMAIFGFPFGCDGKRGDCEELARAWRPYIETCIEAFGTNRCMFESNYPADYPSASYVSLWNAFKLVAKGASAHEKAMLFGGTAQRFYRIDPQQSV